MAKPHTYRVRKSRKAGSPAVSDAVAKADGDMGAGDTRSDRLAAEIRTQRAIYRIGTDEQILRRAAINALMERGEY